VRILNGWHSKRQQTPRPVLFSSRLSHQKVERGKRVGHAGTLDPNATGVLPICLGQAVRVVEYLYDTHKTYRARIELGVSTDTYDRDGQVTAQKDCADVSREQFISLLKNFTGTIEQVPPPYSAVKHRGRSLYEWTRQGITVEKSARRAEIFSIQLVDWQLPFATVDVVCGKGTYIRSLAQEMGQIIGCGACLAELTRLRTGLFDIGDALSLEQLEPAFRYGYWRRYVYAMDLVLQHWNAVITGAETATALQCGKCLPLETPTGNGLCRAYTTDGYFLGVLEYEAETRQWHPHKIFPRPFY